MTGFKHSDKSTSSSEELDDSSNLLSGKTFNRSNNKYNLKLFMVFEVIASQEHLVNHNSIQPKNYVKGDYYLIKVLKESLEERIQMNALD